MSVGLLVIRLALGLLLIGHGTQKLFGWFGGPGLDGLGTFFDSVGYRPGRRMATLAGLAESVAGGLLALGLLTPLGAAIAIGVMVSAIAVHLPKGLWNADGGFELPGLYAVVAAGLAFTGPGRISVDHLLRLNWTWPHGVGALVLGAVAALPLLMLRRRRLAGQRRPSQQRHPRQPGTPAAA